jgi:putative redox protein
MECKVEWMGQAGPSGMTFVAKTGSGHLLQMDGAPEAGGANLAARPMEMLLAGAGGCTAFDVVLILQRGRQDVRDCQVELKAERAETDPKVFTAIHLHFKIQGRALKPETVQRAIALSHEKYCSATAMLGKTATITTSFEIEEV